MISDELSATQSLIEARRLKSEFFESSDVASFLKRIKVMNVARTGCGVGLLLIQRMEYYMLPIYILPTHVLTVIINI